MYIHGYFYNENNDKITVEILTHADRSREIEIGAGGGELWFTDDPVEIESEVNDTFDHVLRHQATVRLLTRNYVPDFFCTNCRDAVVNIYRGEECLFAGYIEPQTYSQGYNEVLDEIELNCIDALTALEYSRYRDVGAAGALYNVVKVSAEQRTFQSILEEIIESLTEDLRISGEQPVRFMYDGSKAINVNIPYKYSIFSDISINELLFLGDEEDDVWQQDQVLDEILKYLNLHIVQFGFDFYIFSWETVKKNETVSWRNIRNGSSLSMERETIDIMSSNVADADTTITVGEVYNQIILTCDVKSIESVIESPLDDDLLKSFFSNKQKYMTEYSSDGEGQTAIRAFDAMTHDQETDYDAGTVTDWYLQIMTNPEWSFPGNGTGNLTAEFCTEGRNQQAYPHYLAGHPGAALISWGKVEHKTDGKDNSPTAKVDMTNYLVVGVNGNEIDNNDRQVYPSEASIRSSIPVAVYDGNTTGGVFSPSDDDTTNYIVLSGKVILNPIMKLTDTYKAIRDYNPTAGSASMPDQPGINQWWHKTVPSRNNKEGRYYTQRWYKATTPSAMPVTDDNVAQGLVPFTGTGPELYEFKYSAVGDRQDHISKVAVLACMLVIGDKCVVESGTEGQPGDFEWRKYKTREKCSTDDEYYQQSFTIGFDPKIGDKLIGTSFDFQNNISHELGIDAEGIAIPIRKNDRVSGAVKFMILGPVNVTWDEVTRRHPTFFRHTKWSGKSIPLMAHVSNIMLESFEVKVYSDNGLVNNTEDSDLVYMSDTREKFVNKKDDIDFKINSGLTSAESRDLGITNSVKISTPLNVRTNEAVLSIYDHNRQIQAKPEQLYVDSYYSEYHLPRVIMEQNFMDQGDRIGMFKHYRHPMMGKTFFVQGIGRNLEEGTAALTLKEIEE